MNWVRITFCRAIMKSHFSLLIVTLDAEILNKPKIDQATLWKRNAQYAMRNIKIASSFSRIN